jgi:N-hydroxyarylamine O-acetyltransferase
MNEANEARLIASLAERVGAPGIDGNSLQALEQLRAMFTMAIAFENLSVLSEASVSLTLIDVLNKLAKKRGGYCFELNTAFAALLGKYGVESKMHLGRVWLRDPEQVPVRNHGTNVVEIEGRSYIADVGFGARAPRCLVPLFDFGTPIDDGDVPGEPIRVIEDKAFGVMIQRRIEGDWANQYSLELEPAYPSDLAAANHFQATSWASYFRHHLVVGRVTIDGRDGLFDNRLTQRRGADTEIRILSSIEEICTVLDNIFDIDPSGHEKAIQQVIDSDH